MKKPIEPLKYIVGLRQTQDYLQVFSPDIGAGIGIKLPKKNSPNGTFSKDISDSDKKALGEAVLKVFDMIEEHLKTKSWKPPRTSFKEFLKVLPERELSVTEFTQIINKFTKVSADTVRRDVDKGIILATKTTGGKSGRGHRKIPYSEVVRYIKYLKVRPKHHPSSPFKEAMKKDTDALLAEIMDSSEGVEV